MLPSGWSQIEFSFDAAPVPTGLRRWKLAPALRFFVLPGRPPHARDQHQQAAGEEKSSGGERLDAAEMDQTRSSCDDRDDREAELPVAGEHAGVRGADHRQLGQWATSRAGLRATAEPASPALKNSAAKTKRARS
jgi:hypothetical protein